MNNAGATRLVSACFDDAMLRSLSRDGALNLMRVMFEPSQMQPRIRNWHMVGARLLARLRNEARGDPTSPSMALLRELGPSVDGGLGAEAHDRLELPIVPVELGVGGATLKLFNTITTFGTPQDVGLQELRIEMSYPMDAETRAFLSSSTQNEKAG
jgi:MmyB-like transcription regulator ligand binding domain